MKFKILQQDFLPILQAVSRSVGVRSQLPILDNILLSAEGKKLKVAATNLEIGVIKFVPVEVEVEGGLTIPAKTILELISGLDEGKISITSEDEILNVQKGSFRAQINGVGVSEFPAIPLAEGAGIKLKKKFLASASSILFAAASDEGRPVLTGILTEVKNGALDLVATDGFRLAHRKIVLGESPQELRNLIPKRTLEEVLRVLDEENAEEISIHTSQNQNQIVFSAGQTTISSRLIDGQFPAWEKIIPQDVAARVIVSTEELLKAIKLAAVFAKNEANIVVLKTLPSLLGLKSEAKEVGSQENEIEAQTSGENLQVAFNTKFLQDILQAASSQQVILEFSGPLSACLIKPVGIEGLEYIIMPVRLS